MDAPTGKYVGGNVALNIILKQRNAGGYVAVDGEQKLGYEYGDYNVASKYYHKSTQYTLYAGTDYQCVKGVEETRHDGISFPQSLVTRDYSSLLGKEKTNKQYAQFRIRNKNNHRTLRATFNFVRDAFPTATNKSLLSYGGSEQPYASQVVSLSKESKTGYKYGVGLSGSFNLPANQILEASISATYNNNKYEYCYGEPSVEIRSNTGEKLYTAQGEIKYSKNYKRGNALSVRLSESYNCTSASYAGTNPSWQHLWTSETILFTEYNQPLWKRASLRFSPGMSMLSYCLHGHDKVNKIGPRAQLTFVIQPANNQYAQLQAFYGNSFPELSFMTAATQQVDIYI